MNSAPDIPKVNGPHRFFYGYVVVIAAFLILLVMFGELYSFGVFFKPVLIEFGWSSATLSGAHSLLFLLFGILSIITGRLTDRFGPRVILIICGSFFSVGYILMSQVSAIWQFYLYYGVIVAVGISGSFVPLVATTARWFTKRRGIMVGIVASGVGTGTLIVPLISTQLILHYGWRTTYIIVGIATLVIVITAAQFLRRDPSQAGQRPYGTDEVEASNSVSDVSGLTLQQVIYTRQLWLLMIVYLFAGFCIQSTLVHIIPHALEMGISAAAAAGILAAIGAFNTGGRVLMGAAADRIGSKATLFISTVMVSASFFWLLVAGDLWMFYPFAAVFGIAYGGFLALLSPVAIEIFGLRSAGVLLGILHFGMGIGEAIGPLVFGRIFDVDGSYHLAFLIGGAINVLGILLILMVRPAVEKRDNK